MHSRPLHANLTSMSIDHYDSAAAIRRARSHTASQACSSFPSTAAMLAHQSLTWLGILLSESLSVLKQYIKTMLLNSLIFPLQV